MHKRNTRKYVSIALFFSIIVLFVTAIAIQVMDMMIDPELYAYLVLNPEKQEAYLLAELMSSFTGIHVVVGFIFAVLSFIHVAINWKALKNYFSFTK